MTEFKYYVYALLDPRKPFNDPLIGSYQPFYIGKGSGPRAMQHFQPNRQGENRRKDFIIKAVRGQNLEVKIVFLLTEVDENTAYEYESHLIEKYGREGYDKEGVLINVCQDNRPPSVKGRKWTISHRKNFSKSRKGKAYGRTCSPEEIKRANQSRAKTRQQKIDAGTLEKRGPVSEESKQKCRETWKKKKEEREQKGEKHWLKDKKQTDEHIQRKRNIWAKKKEEGTASNPKCGDHARGKKQSPEHIRKRIEARMRTILARKTLT